MRLKNNNLPKSIISINKIFINLVLIISTILIYAEQVYSQNKVEFEDKEVYEIVKRAAKLFDKKKYDEALDTFIQAEQLATSEDDKLQIANIIAQGGYALIDRKLYNESLSYYESSLDITKKLNNKQALAFLYTYIGYLNEALGNYDSGIENYHKALQIQRQLNDKTGIAHNLTNIANHYAYLGNYTKSLKLLDEALKLSYQVNDPKEKASAHLTMGHVLLRLRNYQEAIENLVLAQELSKEIDEDAPKAPGEVDINVYALTLKGITSRYQGRYDDAINYYEEALRISKKKKLKDAISYNLTSLGELYLETELYDKALEKLEEAMDISKKQKNKLAIAINQSFIGEVELNQKNYKDSLLNFNESLEFFNEVGDKYRIGRAYIDLGFLKLETKEFDGADINFDKAISILGEIGDREWIRVALFGKAVALEEKGNLAQAETTYKEAVEIFESIRQDVVGGEEGQRIFSEVNEELYEKLISLLLRMGKKEEASKYIERSKSKKLRDTLIETGITSFDENLRALLDQYDQLSRQESSLSYELVQERSKPDPNQTKIKNMEKAIDKTKKEFNELNALIVAQYPQLNYLLGISPQGLSELRQEGKIPQNVAILQYFITKNETFLFIATKDKLVVETIPILKKELNTLVSQYRDVILRNNDIPANNWLNGNKSILEFKDLSTKLYDLLIKPAEDHITDVETLAIVPFGSLNLLPFQALARERTGNDGLEFFIEKKNIIYLTSTNYLNMILRLSKDKRIETVAAFGNPELGHPRWELPFASEEVLTIRSIYPNTAVFLGKDATKSNFKKTWGQNSIMHLAAHGIAKEREPLNENQAKSRALCKARGVCTAEDEDPLLEEERPMILLAPYETGYITNQDITGLPPATVTRLIVLSGCETAVFYEEEDPNVNQLPSLALAFTWVGIPSILATLWSINDEGTSILMKDFYTNLSNGKGLYQSLKDAQLKVLKRTDKYGQPFYWAPFILFGAWD